MSSHEHEAGHNDLNQAAALRSAVNSITTAVMMVDRDLRITYLNDASRQLFQKHGDRFRQVFVGFDPDKMLGECIDRFHRDPSHQRKLLSDPRNLPYVTDIQVLDLTIRLQVSAVIDDNGKYIGSCLEWADMTAARANEKALAVYQASFDAVSKVQAIIEFNLDGTIVTANDNFLNALGYTLPEIQGKHHSIFVEPAYKNSHEYRAFWERLNRGEYDAGEYLRIGRGGKQVWINASYNPIMDAKGKPFKVVKFATEITQQKVAIREVSRVMGSVAEGDFSQQMEGEFQGEFLQLSDAINTSVEKQRLAFAEISSVMAALADRDLSVRMEGEYAGELAILSDAINETVDKLRETVTDIATASTTVGTASGEISEGSASLNERTQSQAAAIEETAASLEELTATVRQNADNAVKASQLAAGASDVATEGGEVVKNAMCAMSAISESSKRVSDIIGVIEQIAFQTNMLALNAAVEAARAGDQGRGFAVVAAEVRTLAQRSAAAAKEIKGLIQDSGDKVRTGSELVGQSGDSLKNIISSVKQVTDIIRDIAAASKEQSAGIDQINQAVVALDQATQQNASLVEETATAAGSLREQVGIMEELVEAFHLEPIEEEEEPPPPPRRQSRGGKPAAQGARGNQAHRGQAEPHGPRSGRSAQSASAAKPAAKADARRAEAPAQKPVVKSKSAVRPPKGRAASAELSDDAGWERF